ncbi:MAG: HAMP domain-containing sensor histidine kinase [Oceanococcaceae bacterium]
MPGASVTRRAAASLVQILTRRIAFAVALVLLVLGLVLRTHLSGTLTDHWTTELEARLDSLRLYAALMPLEEIDLGLYGERYSGHYWEQLDGDDSSALPARSASLAGFSLRSQLPPDWQSTAQARRTILRLRGPLDETLLAVVDWRLADPSDRPQGMVVARDSTALDQLQRELDRILIVLLSGLAIIVVLVSAAVTRWGLQPVRRLQADITAMCDGQQATVNEALPRELQPLAHTVNQLLATQDARMRRQREVAANLAHELKTPLFALHQQAELQDQVPSDLVQRTLARMWLPLEQELARARVHGPQPGLRPTDLRGQFDRALVVLRSDHDLPEAAITLDAAPLLTLPLEARDLFTLLWNLLDNAVRHGGWPVQVRASPQELTVADSGPSSGRVVSRTPDTVTLPSGAGLNLVEHILAAYGWELEVSASALGGRCYRAFSSRAVFPAASARKMAPPDP